MEITKTNSKGGGVALVTKISGGLSVSGTHLVAVVIAEGSHPKLKLPIAICFCFTIVTSSIADIVGDVVKHEQPVS